MGSGVSSFRPRSKSRQPEPPHDTSVKLSPQSRNNREIDSSPENFVLSTSLNSHLSTVERNEVAVNYYLDDVDESTDRYLSNCFSHETPHQNSMQPPHSARSDYSEGDVAVAEMFAHTALSLGMDNEDLLFNLMYFNAGENTTFGTVMNSVQSETIALHSENNTPYKLKPASSTAISGLARLNFGDIETSEKLGLDCECAVCKDEIEDGVSILQIPTCQHFFHEECLLRWINLQGWCPVCRAPVEAATVLATAGLAQEVTPEEGPSTNTGPGADDESDSTPASQSADNIVINTNLSGVRLFEDEDDALTVPVRVVDATIDNFPSQKYVSDASRLPGVKQCI